MASPKAQSTYMAKKVIHKYNGVYYGKLSYGTGAWTKALCFIHNKTWAFKTARQWRHVTCKRCLAKKV